MNNTVRHRPQAAQTRATRAISQRCVLTVRRCRKTVRRRELQFIFPGRYLAAGYRGARIARQRPGLSSRRPHRLPAQLPAHHQADCDCSGPCGPRHPEPDRQAGHRKRSRRGDFARVGGAHRRPDPPGRQRRYVACRGLPTAHVDPGAGHPGTKPVRPSK